MLITREEYENLDWANMTEQEKRQYYNPCDTNNPNLIRVGESFDDWLGTWGDVDLKRI